MRMLRLPVFVALMLALALLVAACTAPAAAPAPAPTSTTAAEPTPKPQPTDTPVPEPTDTPVPEPEPTAEAITPSVLVEDQDAGGGMVTISEVVSAGPGWIVIHAQADGSPGPVIGYSPVVEGSNEDVAVEIDLAGATETLYAMLHVDAGTVGEYEFPGDDGPARVDGQVVTPPFNVTLPEQAAMGGDAVAGEYIFNATAGCGCHFNRDLSALAGGNKFEGPFGVVYSANITSDPATGIGGWTDEEITNAIRFGMRPGGSHDAQVTDGEQLAFIMPKFAAMSDEDVINLVAYLRTLEPVENDVPDREFNVPLQAFTPPQAPPSVAPASGPERGQYLTELVRCSSCHTPNNDMTMLLAGASLGDTVAPNITPDELTGIGLWSDEELVEFLATGQYSDGSEVRQPMRGIVQQSLSKLTTEDVATIVAYLKSLPPIQNEPAPAQ
ncbi:MAG: hypothetical protein J5I90_00500 [Caldilineales bacterium]|nr:hypothetical protein [Caldilineales bacterium]